LFISGLVPFFNGPNFIHSSTNLFFSPLFPSTLPEVKTLSQEERLNPKPSTPKTPKSKKDLLTAEGNKKLEPVTLNEMVATAKESLAFAKRRFQRDKQDILLELWFRTATKVAKHDPLAMVLSKINSLDQILVEVLEDAGHSEDAAEAAASFVYACLQVLILQLSTFSCRFQNIKCINSSFNLVDHYCCVFEATEPLPMITLPDAAVVSAPHFLVSVDSKQPRAQNQAGAAAR
jgi:hypothetical protein